MVIRRISLLALVAAVTTGATASTNDFQIGGSTNGWVTCSSGWADLEVVAQTTVSGVQENEVERIYVASEWELWTGDLMGWEDYQIDGDSAEEEDDGSTWVNLWDFGSGNMNECNGPSTCPDAWANITSNHEVTIDLQGSDWTFSWANPTRQNCGS
jgi:hypothetical protein